LSSYNFARPTIRLIASYASQLCFKDDDRMRSTSSKAMQAGRCSEQLDHDAALSRSGKKAGDNSMQNLCASETNVVVVPSIDLDENELFRFCPDINVYEERQLWHLLLLRNPSYRIVYLTSDPVDERVIQYYLKIGGCFCTAEPIAVPLRE